jgi:acyl-CoA synthetase (AMP-forming)/AMP-acid ligase II
MRTIPSILHENACEWPNRPALIATRGGSEAALTFQELEEAVIEFAAQLNARGIHHGDPVLVFVPMSLELYVALLAIFRLGAIAVFVDPSSGLRHINACCEKLPPAALISVWPLRWLRPFISGLRRIPRVFTPPRLSPVSNPVDAAALPCLPVPENPALITFTSGSTGAPKAAVRTHQFLIAQHEALEPGEVDLTTLPVFVLANLASGVTSVLPDTKISHPGSVNAPRLASQIQRLRPTRTGGSPAFYQRLMDEPSSLASFRKIYTGGAPVFPSFLQKLQALAPKAEVVAVYGSTEAEPIAHIACHEITASDWQAMREGKGLLAGIPVPEVRLRIIADQWEEPVLLPDAIPQGNTGEIVVTGEHVLKGYLKGEGDGETKFLIDGEIWHRTGDAGYLDATGRLWLLGRCAARIHDDKGALYPFAVECIAMSFPFVRRAAFILLKGKRLLAIEVYPGSSEADLTGLKCNLAWAAVDEVRTVRSIPVDARHNAKVNYPKLMAELQ